MLEAILAGVRRALVTAAVAVGLCYELIQRKIEQVEVEIKSMQRVRDDLHAAFEEHDARDQANLQDLLTSQYLQARLDPGQSVVSLWRGIDLCDHGSLTGFGNDDSGPGRATWDRSSLGRTEGACSPDVALLS